MTLYTLYSDFDHFAVIGYDENQIVRLCGKTPRDRFDFLGVPRPYKDILTEPLTIDFSDNSDGLAGIAIPDIQVFHGRMFLSERACNVLKNLIQNDGELIPVVYEKGDGYIFNPLSVAETVDGLDASRCIKNEWGDIENIGFYEDRVSVYAIFKTKFDTYINFYCREDVKMAIENAKLKGVVITPELGARFGMTQNQKYSPN